jgi:hypothetical protein
MRHRPLLPVLPLLAVAVLTWGAAACGKKEPAAPQSRVGAPEAKPAASGQAKINAGEYLTKDDAGAAMGGAVGDAKTAGNGSDTSSCNYFTSDFRGLGLLMRAHADAATAQGVFGKVQAESKSISGVDPVAVEGIGEKAFWAGGKLNQLNVLKGRYWLIFTVTLGGDKSQDIAKQAAAKAVPRVP